MKTKLAFSLALTLLILFSQTAFSAYWCKVEKMSQQVYTASKDNKKKSTIICSPYGVKNLPHDLGMSESFVQEKIRILVQNYQEGKSFLEKISHQGKTWTIRTWDFQGIFQEGDNIRFNGFKRLLMIFNPAGSKVSSFILASFPEYVYAAIPTVRENYWLALSLHTSFLDHIKDPGELEKQQFMPLNLQFGRGLFTLLMFTKEQLIAQLKQYLFEVRKNPAPREIGRMKDLLIAFNPEYDSRARAKTLGGLEMIFRINEKGNLFFSIIDPVEKGDSIIKTSVFIEHELNPKQVDKWIAALGLEEIKKAVGEYKKKMD